MTNVAENLSGNENEVVDLYEFRGIPINENQIINADFTLEELEGLLLKYAQSHEQEFKEIVLATALECPNMIVDVLSNNPELAKQVVNTLLENGEFLKACGATPEVVEIAKDALTNKPESDSKALWKGVALLGVAAGIGGVVGYFMCKKYGK